jgi:hypothetical protein
MPSLWRRAAALRAELGALDAALYLFDRAAARLSGGRVRLYKYVLVAQPVRPAAAPPRGDGATVIEGLHAGHPAIASLPRPAAVVQERLRSGARCLVATVHGRFAGCLWYAVGSYREDEVICDYHLLPAQCCAWDFDVYVAPEFRGGRIFWRLWHAAAAAMSDQGIRWSFSRISAFNAASLRSHERLGAVPVGGVVFLRLGGLQLGSRRGAWLARASATQRPRIELHAPADPASA